MNNKSYSVLAINDLGMHCGDLDTRIASILPPFQVLLAQVVQRAAPAPRGRWNPAGVSVFYSAAANPNDPILVSTVFDGVMANGDTYKTNFWEFPVPAGTYDAFYPAYNPLDPTQTLTPLAGPPFNVSADIGPAGAECGGVLHRPDGLVDSCKVQCACESCDGKLTAVLHAMPGIAGPYTANDPKPAQEHYLDKPFFLNFPFGYVAADVNWYEGAGVPFAAFDDNGRETPTRWCGCRPGNAAATKLCHRGHGTADLRRGALHHCHADPGGRAEQPDQCADPGAVGCRSAGGHQPGRPGTRICPTGSAWSMRPISTCCGCTTSSTASAM